MYHACRYLIQSRDVFVLCHMVYSEILSLQCLSLPYHKPSVLDLLSFKEEVFRISLRSNDRAISFLELRKRVISQLTKHFIIFVYMLFPIFYSLKPCQIHVQRFDSDSHM